jgi:hypothetical protein
MSGIFSLSDMRKQGVHVCLKPIYIIMLCHKQMLVVSYRDVYPPKEGQTIQWTKTPKTMIYKTLHRKLTIKHHEPHKNRG